MSGRSSSPTCSGEGALVRVGARISGGRVGALLDAFRGLPRGMWERDGRWCAWAGSAASIAVAAGHGRGRFRRVRRWADATSGRVVELGDVAPASSGPSGGAPVRFHGGFAFDPGRRSSREGARDVDPWSGFPAALFHLPAVEARRADEGLRLTVTVPAGPAVGREPARDAARRALRRVRRRIERAGRAGDGEADASGAASRRKGGGARPLQTRGRPDRGRWAEIVGAALVEVRAGRLEKVVPARLVEVELDAPPDPAALAARLRADNPGSFPYLVEPEPGRAFAGAAPEIVAALRDGRFHATAVAGTVPDAEDPDERRRLARRLLASVKDRREHEVGVRDMRRALQDVTGVARVDEEPRVLRLRGVQHLLTNVAADASPEMHVLELLEAMHPTAAVNGTPRDAARGFLRREEPFDRGWYAGPVGWFDASGDGEFAPGLRSVLVRGRRVRMFAGAGIVAGSEADREWEETGLKFRPVAEALGLDPGRWAADRPGAVASGARSTPDL